ncbi:MAG TPA: hypothetical protein VJ746_12005 [Nitrospira sp.]|nr:hypothetical protein [Nitrospira sp.]
MHLLRLATLYFSPALKSFHAWKFNVGSVEVETYGHYEIEGRSRLLVAAKVDITEKLKTSPDEFVIIPDLHRREAESAIETVSNLISISLHSKRNISSPIPCVALLPDSPEATEWLESTKGLDQRFQSVNHVQADIPLIQVADSLADRLDGVSLLGEAIAHGHLVGQFHEYIRLFERAFALGSAKLENPLTRFLKDADHGYTHKEVKKWLTDLRGPATHADRREKFVLEVDIRPVIHRIQQAAYEVLFNKKEWRNPSITRRIVWDPPAKPVSANPSQLEMTGGCASTLTVQLLDHYGSYPLDLTAGLNTLPQGWWAKHEAEKASDIK